MSLPANCRMMTYEGTTLHLAAWARKTGIPSETIGWRVRQGLPPAQCLSHATRKPIVIEYDGRRLRLSEWAERIGISLVSLRKRLKKGETPPHLFRPPRNQKGMPWYAPKGGG